jgi:hypothetical protein
VKIENNNGRITSIEDLSGAHAYVRQELDYDDSSDSDRVYVLLGKVSSAQSALQKFMETAHGPFLSLWVGSVELHIDTQLTPEPDFNLSVSPLSVYTPAFAGTFAEKTVEQ